MPETQIYQLDLSAGDISVPGSFHSSSFGGGDTPISGYPEIARAENIHRDEGAGPGSVDVIDAVDTDDYTTAWCVLMGIGPLSNGQYDCRNLHVRWKQYFSSDALAEGDRYAIVLVHGMDGGSDTGLGAGNIFMNLQMIGTGGTGFDWAIEYRKVNGSFFNFAYLEGSSDVADNAWHVIDIELTPATVTGAFNGLGSIGSASVASDGAISVVIDPGTGSELAAVSVSGVQFVVNQLSTTNPGVYYGRGLWHGD